MRTLEGSLEPSRWNADPTIASRTKLRICWLKGERKKVPDLAEEERER